MTLKNDWVNGDQYNASDQNAVANAVNASYAFPGGGIPKTDLAAAVQTSLGKADSALQAVASTTITDATVTGRAALTAANAAALITAAGGFGTTSGTICQGNDSRVTGAVQPGGALGTPSSGTLTNCTGLPVAGVTASTSTALGVGSVELGHATDTTLTRSAAGKLAVEGVDVVLSGGAGQVADLSIVGFGSNNTRAASSYGDFSFGIKLQRAVTFTSVTFRAATADASGNLVVELRKNGTQVSGTSTTIAAASQVAGGTSTGTWAFAAGDIVTVYVTGVGTTPGKGLIADIKGLTT